MTVTTPYPNKMRRFIKLFIKILKSKFKVMLFIVIYIDCIWCRKILGVFTNCHISSGLLLLFPIHDEITQSVVVSLLGRPFLGSDDKCRVTGCRQCPSGMVFRQSIKAGHSVFRPLWFSCRDYWWRLRCGAEMVFSMTLLRGFPLHVFSDSSILILFSGGVWGTKYPRTK